LFGASTGAAAALEVAAQMPQAIAAVVSRGGRPDLAGGAALGGVRAPTLLIVGGDDYGVIELNQGAHAALGCVKELAIVPGETHLFEERGALEIAPWPHVAFAFAACLVHEETPKCLPARPALLRKVARLEPLICIKG
jgi:pimeloyl-ACP methyl ester carboxylesterase